VGPIDKRDKDIFDFKEALLLAEEGIPSFSHGQGGNYYFSRPAEDACFLDLENGALHTLPSCLRDSEFGYTEARINFAYRNYDLAPAEWIPFGPD